MNKKKKIILITVLSIIVIAVAIGIIWFVISNNKEDPSASKLDKLYSKLEEKGNYSVSMILNDENETYYAKQENVAYIYDTYNGTSSEYVIRDGNTYLLMDNDKVFYTYNNNQTDLNRVENEISKIKKLEYETGEEEIEDKKYSYEEYKGLTNFSMMDTSEIDETQEIKTRFYFKKDELCYIKTIVGEKEELLKVNIEYKADSKLFEIPEDYKSR